MADLHCASLPSDIQDFWTEELVPRRPDQTLLQVYVAKALLLGSSGVRSGDSESRGL